MRYLRSSTCERVCLKGFYLIKIGQDIAKARKDPETRRLGCAAIAGTVNKRPLCQKAKSTCRGKKRPWEDQEEYAARSYRQWHRLSSGRYAVIDRISIKVACGTSSYFASLRWLFGIRFFSRKLCAAWRMGNVCGPVLLASSQGDSTRNGKYSHHCNK